ncbi:hypothetical protein [Thermobrachium celere]|nr:hypothetical protein [Thermobrachium celere]GFR34808.1 hypothetical protein TCEA9_06200 [Thermobrachium celere]
MFDDFDLVDVSEITNEILFDIRYATDRNYFKKKDFTKIIYVY